MARRLARHDARRRQQGQGRQRMGGANGDFRRNPAADGMARQMHLRQTQRSDEIHGEIGGVAHVHHPVGDGREGEARHFRRQHAITLRKLAEQRISRGPINSMQEEQARPCSRLKHPDIRPANIHHGFPHSRHSLKLFARTVVRGGRGRNVGGSACGEGRRSAAGLSGRFQNAKIEFKRVGDAGFAATPPVKIFDSVGGSPVDFEINRSAYYGSGKKRAAGSFRA